MIKDFLALIKEVTEEIRDFTDIAVIGMSGGADSTLVATLCTWALGKKNVYGFGMPYNKVDEDTFNQRSEKTAKKLGISYDDIPIFGPTNRAAHELENAIDVKLSPLNLGNIKSRMRMIFLYSLNAQLAETYPDKRCRVIGTGNLSEDYIGYDTKGGDALADIFPIGSLFKSEVYQLLDHFVEMGALAPTMIDRVPSAGLESGQTDDEDLGYSYYEMEAAIRLLRAECDDLATPVLDSLDLKTLKFVRDRHSANKHKHEAVPVIDLSGFRV